MVEKFIVVDGYTCLLRCFNTISPYITDIDIVNGYIREIDSSRTWMMEIDLTNIIDDLSLPIQLIKEKLKLFELFKKQDVTIQVDDTKYSISDEISKFTFTMPNRDYIDDKFISEEDKDSRFKLMDENLLTQFTITQQISERIKVSCEVFNVTTLRLMYSGDILQLMTQNVSKNTEVIFMNDIPLNLSIDNKFSLISFIPFTLDHDGDMEVSIYEVKDFLVVKSNMSLFFGDSNININTYSMTDFKPLKSLS